MKFRRFTPAGIETVRDYLAVVKTSGDLESVTLASGRALTRADLLSLPAYSSSVLALADLDFDDTRIFPTTFAFCEYLDSLLKDRNPNAYRTDVGFWTYLAMAYLPQLVKVKNGRPFLGEMARWVYVPQIFTKAYRHSLAAFFYVYEMYREAPELSRVVLCHDFNVFGDIPEQVLSRSRMVQMPVFIAALTALYYDDEKQSIKRGANNKGRGSVRRMIDVLDQLSLTRDLYDIEDRFELLKLLPSEFDAVNPLHE